MRALLSAVLTVLLASSHATNTEESLVPIIDISSWTTVRSTSTEEEKDSVVRAVAEACRTVGFFMIRNHGIDNALIKQTWNVSRDFFDLEKTAKRQFCTQNEAEYPYGFEESEQLVKGKQLDGQDSIPASIDEKETFAVGPQNLESGMPLRRWYGQPNVVPKFEATLVSYYEAMEQLAGTLLQVFALGLQQDEDYFVRRMTHHSSALRLVNYYPLDPPRNDPAVIRAGAHTDYGVTTILTAQQPGLQVLLNQTDWYSVPFVEDALIINLGDLMERWTNDQWASTLHRVVMPSDDSLQRRYSMAFFVNVNGDTEVSPLESCTADENDRLAALQKYPTITAMEHLMAKHLASMRKSSDYTSNTVDTQTESTSTQGEL